MKKDNTANIILIISGIALAAGVAYYVTKPKEVIATIPPSNNSQGYGGSSGVLGSDGVLVNTQNTLQTLWDNSNLNWNNWFN